MPSLITKPGESMWRKLDSLQFLVLITTIFCQTDALFRIKRFHTDAIKIHNVLRFLHNSRPLSFSVKLADAANKTATDYLDKLQLGYKWETIIPLFSHDNNTFDIRQYFEMYSENAWHKKLEPNTILDDDPDEWPQDLSVINPIQEWYNTGGYYRWEASKDPNDDTVNALKPFAQLVWNTSLTAGCGYAKDWELVVIVCRYQPIVILGKWRVMNWHVPKFVSNKLLLPDGFLYPHDKKSVDGDNENINSNKPSPPEEIPPTEEPLNYEWTDEPLD